MRNAPAASNIAANMQAALRRPVVWIEKSASNGAGPPNRLCSRPSPATLRLGSSGE